MGSGVVFDPRPLPYRDSDPKVYLEKLRCDLQDLNHESVADNDIRSLSIILKEEVKTEEDILNALSLSPIEREELEINSREQSSSSLWFESRRIRITGSKYGCIILQKEKT